MLQYADYILNLFLIHLALLLVATGSPVTNPYILGSDASKIIPDYFDSKKTKAYFNATPVAVNEDELVRYDDKNPSCNIQFQVKWTVPVGSSVYSSPVIFPVGHDEKKQIYVNTFYQYVEVIDSNGYKPWSWPIAFEDSSFQSSPMIYDIDGDGTNDIGVVDKNANVYWIRVGEYGQYLNDYHIQIPKLKVAKEWMKNLDPEYVDRYVMLSMFDHHEDNAITSGTKTKNAKIDELSFVKQVSYPELNPSVDENQRRRLQETFKQTSVESSINEIEDLTVAVPESAAAVPEAVAAVVPEAAAAAVPEAATVPEAVAAVPEAAAAGTAEAVGAEAAAEAAAVIENDQHDASIDFGDSGVFGNRDQDDYVGRMRGDDVGAGDFNRDFQYGYGYANMYDDKNFVFVDSHVLGSPTLIDINQDGKMDIVFAVSYYFDTSDYAGKALDYEPSNYIAGGVVVWNIDDETWTWMVHLDLTTNLTKFKALIYGTPTIADIDGNGRNEILIGTSLGLLYILDGDTGFVRRYFPMQFHEIQAQIAVADVKGGLDLEIIVADMGGNLVLLNADGDVLWDVQLSGSLPHTPVVGDVNGDGQLDIVVNAVDKDNHCHIWAIDGATGQKIKGYPMALPKGGMVSSSILLVDLHDYTTAMKRNPSIYSDPNLPIWMQDTSGHLPVQAPSLDATDQLSRTGTTGTGNNSSTGNSNTGKHRGLHMLIPSYDGHLYIIDSQEGCAERIDVGEHMYSMPLVDDVDGDGRLDLLLGTMNGQVMLIETGTAFHPLNAWSSFPKHRGNVFTHGQLGISIPELEKKKLKYSSVGGGDSLKIVFDIWDTRGDATLETKRFDVAVYNGTNKLHPLVRQSYDKPGRYTIQMPVNPPVSAVFTLSMTTEHGLYFEDNIAISISTRFYVWIKYMILAPICLLCLPLLLLRSQHVYLKLSDYHSR